MSVMSYNMRLVGTLVLIDKNDFYLLDSTRWKGPGRSRTHMRPLKSHFVGTRH